MDLHSHRFIFTNLSFDQLKEDHIKWNSIEYHDIVQSHRIRVENIDLNQGHFTCQGTMGNQIVSLIQQDHQILLFCNCDFKEEKLCSHQASVLSEILRRDDLKTFFSNRLRQQKLKQFASSFGLEKEEALDLYFFTKYENGHTAFSPRQPGLIPVNRDLLSGMAHEVMGEQDSTAGSPGFNRNPNVLILKPHKYYQSLQVELYQAPLSKEGIPKNPFTLTQPMECIWSYSNAEELRFLISVAELQKRLDQKYSPTEIMALRTIIKNALQCQFFIHNPEVSEKISAKSIQLVKVLVFPGELELEIQRKDYFYRISGILRHDGEVYNLKDLPFRFGCFIQRKNTFYLIDNAASLQLIDMLKKHPEDLYVHASKFAEFKTEFLDKLESKIKINYQYIPIATPAQLEASGFDSDIESILYLTDLGEFVKISPVVRYSDIEVNIRTKRTISGLDEQGKEFVVTRDKDRELKLLSILIRQHPHFMEQLENELDYFYLHRKYFLNENWFLETFRAWREQKITILGFNKLSGNKFSGYSPKISIKVESGINWFNTKITVQFGKRKASLKKIQNAVRNKSRYLQLDDGTIGILPEEWLKKFSGYFNAGEITDDVNLRTSKINFSSISEIYDPEMLDETVMQELEELKHKFATFQEIRHVEVPRSFTGTLRPYQQEGLNWLNYLDDFNFGGCLADEMGLGKTVQIIVFILSQRIKIKDNTNLIVAPTSVISNWENELNKFAPDIRIHLLHGPQRVKDTRDFEKHEVVLTTYNTLLTDINFLRKYSFNYVFLDESQNIKNPESQRYRAVMQLKSRNKIAITGTPVENNTFDLYSQFSFACPGLLGSQSYFRAIYSIPIDKFKLSSRAELLRQKIKPFLLRRTKNQVAADLPEKTEMVVYCELKPEQRKIYDAYEKEFRDYISATGNEELRKNSMHVLKGLTRLRQICNSPKLIDQETKNEPTSSKIDILLEHITDQAPQHKLLIFSQFVSMLELIQTELEQLKIPYVMLTGSTRNRQALVDQFQNDPDTRIFLISLKAGGTGLNLTEASYVYLVDPWWNPAVENQAIDRTHRIGQHQNVTAIRLITPDTIEEKIIELQKNKKALSKDLIQGDQSFFQSLSRDELLSLFRKN